MAHALIAGDRARVLEVAHAVFVEHNLADGQVFDHLLAPAVRPIRLRRRWVRYCAFGAPETERDEAAVKAARHKTTKERRTKASSINQQETLYP